MPIFKIVNKKDTKFAPMSLYMFYWVFLYPNALMDGKGGTLEYFIFGYYSNWLELFFNKIVRINCQFRLF